ncbi:MAG TPA: Crp/Fnr family transcriptional regulator [Patescibacteria group bacterium]|nr:Crp/Fnr family transcriptional regulator [Patescibacteria group bacterium]
MTQAIKSKLDTFFNQHHKHSYKKGELLIRAGDEPQGIMYLVNGRVKVYTISRKGEEVIVNIFKEGSFFPMSWALDSLPNRYFFEALTPVEVWRAPKQDVIDFLHREPEVLFDLLTRVYSGMEGVLLRMAYLMGEDAYTRLVSELLITAKRFGQKNSDQTLTLELSEKDLAAQTGMTRETVSREMKKLKQKKLINLKKDTMVIANLSHLEAELENL